MKYQVTVMSKKYEIVAETNFEALEKPIEAFEAAASWAYAWKTANREDFLIAIVSVDNSGTIYGDSTQKLFDVTRRTAEDIPVTNGWLGGWLHFGNEGNAKFEITCGIGC